MFPYRLISGAAQPSAMVHFAVKMCAVVAFCVILTGSSNPGTGLCSSSGMRRLINEELLISFTEFPFSVAPLDLSTEGAIVWMRRYKTCETV
jgi:hypothetical protein